MNSFYCKEKLNLFDTLLKKSSDITYGRIWTIEPSTLRFKHGESITELKVPYHMGADDEACIEGAILGLAALLTKRFAHVPVEAGKVALPALMLHAQAQAPREKTFLLDLFIADSPEKALASGIISTTPSIDTAILFSWLGPDGQGRKFMRWAETLLEKALREEARLGWEEKTSYLALLAAINTIRRKKEKVKDLRIKGFSYEKLDLMIGLAMFMTLRTAVKDLLERLKFSTPSLYNPSVEVLLLSAMVPRAFLAIPTSILATSLNPYGINSEVYEALLPYGQDFSEDIEGSAELINSTVREVRGLPEVMDAVKGLYDISRFREEALRYLFEFDAPGISAHNTLYDLYGEDRLIRNFISDQKLIEGLSGSFEEVRERFPRDTRRIKAASDFQRFLATFRKKSVLSGLFGGGRKEELDALMAAIEGFYGCMLDEHIERFEGLMRAALADRRGEYDQKTIREEYNRGRLYRFSVDERPLVKTLEHGEEGQLFVDMKDFTRKTLKVKEIAMAEFMREHFYRPIISAAGRYSAGSGMTADERGIWLTNLPGDAAIFSGGVVYLVSLAKDIQRIIRRYRETLARKLPPRKDAELIEEVHKRFEVKQEELRRKRAELNEALDRGETGLDQKLIALGEEEHRLENTYRDELEACIKGELEAGLYIAYGAKAETMIIESKGEASGPVKVTIGEKINEASRGTFRHSMVRAKLEILLEQERIRRRNKQLRYPFDIYIDRIYSLRMPPELEGPFEKLITSRKASGAQAMSQIMSNAFLNDLKKMISGESFSTLRLVTSTTDIYNKGQALSQDALMAYMRESKGAKFFFKKTVAAGSLDRSIQDSFFFPTDPLEFWFGYEVLKGAEQIEGFYRCGEVIFKGFETNNPTIIYEMLNQDGDFFKALVKHHFHPWLEEARGSKEAETF